MDLRRSKRKPIPPRHDTPEKENNADTKASWDDWVPQDRLRKFNEENKELASNLKKEMDAQRRAASKPSVVSSVSAKKRGLGSELASSARGSEERSSIAPTRGVKRARDGKELEGIERVRLALSRAADRKLTVHAGRGLFTQTSHQAADARHTQVHLSR